MDHHSPTHLLESRRIGSAMLPKIVVWRELVKNIDWCRQQKRKHPREALHWLSGWLTFSQILCESELSSTTSVLCEDSRGTEKNELPFTGLATLSTPRQNCLYGLGQNKKMHRPGIEPGPPAWQASILPLNHRCKHILCIKGPPI